MATLHELESVYDYCDVLDMNEALDWMHALEAAAVEKPGGR